MNSARGRFSSLLIIGILILNQGFWGADFVEVTRLRGAFIYHVEFYMSSIQTLSSPYSLFLFSIRDGAVFVKVTKLCRK